MNEVFDYKIKIIHLNTCLQKMMNDLYAYGINLGMLNELKDLPRIFKSDQIPIDIEVLEAIHDPLVKPLLQLIYAFDRNRALCMVQHDLSEGQMANAFDQTVGEAQWPDFFLFKGKGYMNLACSILQYQQQILVSLFCLARQLSESRMYCIEADYQRPQYPVGEALNKINTQDRNVYLILDMMMETHESMQTVYEIAEAFQDR